MDIYSVEKNIVRILTFIQEMAKADTGYYSKSIQRLERIAETSQKVTEVVNSILGVKEPQKVEIEQSSDWKEMADFFTKEFKELKDLVKGVSNQPRVTEQVQEKPPINNDVKFAPTDRKAIVSKYASVLEKLAKTYCNVSVANECTAILWRWYEARIFGVYPNAQQFNYNPRSFKDLLYALVLTFGYHFENKTLEVFLSDFEEWLINLRTSPSSHTYIAQKEVYQVYKDMGKEYATLTAVVLWDVLWDSGLKELCNVGNQHNANLSEYGIWDKVKKANPTILDHYKHYEEDDPSILERLNLI